MLDAIHRPKKERFVTKGEQSRWQFQPKRPGQEMKVWLAILATSAVIIGIWLFTFRLPQVKKPPRNQDVSQLKSSLEGMLEDLKDGWRAIQSQKPAVRQDQLSPDQITKITQQLLGAATSSTSTTLSLPQTNDKSNANKKP